VFVYNVVKCSSSLYLLANATWKKLKTNGTEQ